MTIKTSHTQRLLRIKELLIQEPCSIANLQAKLKDEGIEIGERQIYRNIKEIGETLLKAGEKLNPSQKGDKVWMIETSGHETQLSTYDINSYIISQATNPYCLKGRQTSLDKLNNHIGSLIAKTKYNDNPNWKKESIESSHFYEFHYNERTHKDKIEDLLNCAGDHLEVELISYEGDSVSLYQCTKLPFTFYPIRLVYHRGVFFVIGIIKTLDKVITLDINQITAHKILQKSFSREYKKLKSRVDLEMTKRFGITQNVDEYIYKVELEFSSITGLYVKNHIWHNTQQFEKMPCENWKMTMECGMNRELVGWVFQWMGNVKIINPPELKTLYAQQMAKMAILNDGGELVYSNIFQPD